VNGCYEEITGRMQRTMDRLAEEHPHPILTRLGELGPRWLQDSFGRRSKD
jgi:hypothetical protein